MFTKILIATDLSAASHAVVQCATGLRSLGAKECLLLQCMNSREPAAPGMALATVVVEQALLDQKALLEKSGLRVSTEVVPGMAHIEINRIARERGMSLIVVGSHGHTLLNDMPLGGVSAAVLHQAVTPVLLVRVRQTADGTVVCAGGETCDFMRNILFPTDFSESARHAFETVKHLAASGAGEATLFHVQDKSRIDPHLKHRLDEFNETDRQRLTEMKDLLAKSGATKVGLDIRLGHPGQEILRESESRQATLVVMGSQGRGFFGELFLGSVSHYVARRSQVPVLLIPPPSAPETR